MQPKKHFYNRLWFWTIIFIAAYTVIVMVTGDSDSLSEVEEDKQANAAEYEEADGIVYWEGTCAADFFTALCEDAQINAAAEAAEGENFAVYRAQGDLYYIYIEADPETDEIHYFRIDVLDVQDAASSAAFFVNAVTALGVSDFYDADITQEVFAADAAEACEQIAENPGSYSLIGGTAASCYEIFTNDSDGPSFEVLARNTADSGESE